MSRPIDSNQLALWLALILAIIGGVFYVARLEADVGDNANDIRHHKELIGVQLIHIASQLKDIKAQTSRD